MVSWWDMVSSLAPDSFYPRFCRYVQASRGPLTHSASVYYFFSDVFPPMYDGYRPMDPPAWWRSLFEHEMNAGPVEAGTEEEVHFNNQRQLVAPPPPAVG